MYECIYVLYVHLYVGLHTGYIHAEAMHVLIDVPYSFETGSLNPLVWQS